MQVAELMAQDLKTVQAGQTIAEAVLTLADAHIYGAPVVENNTGKLIGVLSASDVLERLAEASSPEARNEVFDNTLVRDVMTPRPAHTTPDEDVKEAAQQMLYLDVHRLFVLDGGRLVGLISQSDIVRAVGTAKI